MPVQMPGETARDIAIGVLISGLLIAVTLRSPILGFFCTFLTPLPTLYYRLKLGRTPGLLIPVISLGLLVGMTGRITLDLVFFLELMGIGYILAELFNHRWSLEKTVLTVCAVVWSTGLLAAFATGIVSGEGLGNLVSGYVRQNLEATIALYEGMGMSDENIQVIKDAFDQIQYVLVRIIPALVVCSTLFVTWTSLLLARALLNRKGLPIPVFAPLNRWKAPDGLVWGVIAGGIMLLLPSASLKLVGINGLIILMMVYFFQGIAVVSFFFNHKRVPRIFRYLFYSLIALQQVFLFIVIGVGFIDIWMNFRNRLEPKSE